ncbi:MAG: NifB/NifX family molybdenum-iron cluster-binding protein [Candidatus Helarchaeota archaeon]
MRIAVPTEYPGGLDAPVSQHFGHVAFFTIVEIDYDEITKDTSRIKNLSKEDIKSVKIVGNPMEEHTCFTPVKVLIDNGIDVLLINGIGGRPLMFCLQNGIKVYNGALGTVLEAVRDFLAGFLTETLQGTCMGRR